MDNKGKKLPKGWIKCFSNRKKQAYYFNTITREKQWQIPSVETTARNSSTNLRLNTFKKKNLAEERLKKLRAQLSKGINETKTLKSEYSINISNTQKLFSNILKEPADINKNELPPISKERKINRAVKKSALAKLEQIRNCDPLRINTEVLPNELVHIKTKKVFKQKKKSNQPQISSCENTSLTAPSNNISNRLKKFKIPKVNLAVSENTQNNFGAKETSHVPEAEEEMICEPYQISIISESVLLPPLDCSDFINISETESKNFLVCVIDTNIFIEDLSLVKELVHSFLKGYKSEPILVIAWRVIAELDGLKKSENRDIKSKAIMANDFLSKNITSNARIKGQTPSDANNHLIPCETSDDEILNCSLQVKAKGVGDVLLVTNDKNLSIKAAMNSIKTVTRNQLYLLMKDYPNEEDIKEISLSPDLNMLCENLRTFLTTFLEEEMKLKYGDGWKMVIYKPPPWTLIDIFECIKHQWAALFSHILNDENIIDQLYKQLLNKDLPNQEELELVKSLIENLVKLIQISPNYMVSAELLLKSLYVNTDRDTNESVAQCFEFVWRILSSYCFRIAKLFEVPNDLEDVCFIDVSDDVLKQNFTKRYNEVQSLMFSIKAVKNASVESLCKKCSILVSVLNNILKETSTKDVPEICVRSLIRFALYNRNLLEEALVKFHLLGELLHHCQNLVICS